ncbi:MAG TPA: M1 family metallopeptidase, partial [Bacillota bacterium]|nr:M1 family metallopeptidase [Bacillota bacterium]
MSKNVQRLFEGFEPESYQLFIDPDFDTRKVRGNVTVVGKKKGRPSQRLTFHQHGVKVTHATITKNDKKGDAEHEVVRINHQQTMDEVRLHTDGMLYAGKYTVYMEFEASVSDGMNGIYSSDYKVDGKEHRMLSTQFESHFGRRAFPHIDEPQAKATFTLTLASPKGLTAISNTPARDQTEVDGKLHTTFETTPRMSSYLLAFVIGDLHSRETTTSSGVAVRVWATKAHQPAALDFALDTCKRSIEFFEDFFDTPYPLTKCDNVAIPDFSAGAMENWGLLTYREYALLADPETVSQSGREVIAEVVGHEVSHQWFGDLVTMKWWDETWLNESFANVMAYVVRDALYPEWRSMDSYVIDEGLSALRRDCIAGVQAVHTPVHHPDEISSLFDPSIVYAKGGRLLYMLMNYVGRDAFRKGLKAYFAKHAYGNTSGSDLWTALSVASGLDVTHFIEPWLLRSGYPLVTVAQKGADLVISQSHFLLDMSKADPERLWPVPLLASSSDVPALLDTRELHVTLSKPDYIRLDTGAIGHYIVRYTEPAHAEALAQQVASKELGIPERLMLLNSSSSLARAGVQSYDATLRLLEHYQDEDSEPVWGIMSMILGEARRFVDDDPSLEDRIKASMRRLVEKQYARLGWEERSGESSQDVMLRATILALGAYAEQPEIVTRGLELFDAYKQDPKQVPGQIRGVVFGIAVRNAHPGAFDYLLELDATTAAPEVKQDIMGSLSATKSADEAAQLLSRLKDGDKVRQQDVDHWLILLMRNRNARPQAWQWLQDNWPWIEETFRKDSSYDYFPRYAASAFNTRTLLEEYRAF